MIRRMASARSVALRRMDWVVFFFRWLLLTSAALLIVWDSRSTELSPLVVALFTAALVYTGALTALKFLDYHPRPLSWIALSLDFVVAIGLFIASGGSTGPLIWIGILPGLTAALRFQRRITLYVAVLFTLIQIAFTLAVSPTGLSRFGRVGLDALILWPLVFGVAFAANRLRGMAQIRAEKEQEIEAERTLLLRSHARAIYEMASMVSATLDYEQVLEAALDFGAMGAEGTHPTSSRMISAVLYFRDDQLHVESARRFTASDYRKVCSGREGALGEVIRTGEPLIIANPADDPELTQFASFQACNSLMALPLRAGYETYGVVVYGHPDPDFFDEDQQALLDAVVNQAIIALQNAQLYRNLRSEKERLIQVQEEGQKKLARDLHDGPTQSVAALAMRANFVRRLLERDPQSAGEELFKMEELARRTTKEIRHMLFTLRPLVLESQGLTAALQQLADKMRETHGQNVIVEAEKGIDDKLELNYQGVLFYVVEEAVNNARKHAQAEHIWVRLRTQRDILGVEIQDDGVGFNVGAVDASYEKRGSLGMVNMRERAEMLSGAVKIASAEGKGTRITVLVPLTEEARERVRA